MAILKKSEPFIVPSLAEANSVYGELLAKRIDLNSVMSGRVAEQRRLEKEIAADTSREVRPSIAALLGDAPGSKALNRKRLAEVNSEIKDIESAMRILEQRIKDAHTAANRDACAILKPEFDKRIAAMVNAMRVLDAAHRDFDDLCGAAEAEDIRVAHIAPKPFFLGGAREADRRIAAYIREAGYAV
ncbi:hypothetical protein [Mesorhizobium sp.]|uniref:hypothetical protein n=1 Tax=Mesorhizobium sp. TaxID=1871066 RepID=UPI001212E2AA|nr:hypothetical protein [Mesorhizobium sp.]TIO04097.1 MAG: hypothetical protein E5X88_33315 [Mesorhizobium sp.]TIO29338.1 MAG: hypothetical protein E5X89_31245 [Mesorhizobium sp.]